MLKRMCGVLAGTLAAMVIGGCGGGGSGAPFVVPPPVPKNVVMSLYFDTPQLVSDGRSTVVVTAEVRDATTNAALVDEPVTFSVDSGRISVGSAKTDASGSATTAFDSNNDKSNRTVTVTARAGSATVTASLKVIGTTILFGGSPSGIAGKPTEVVISVLDGGSNKVAGAVVALSATGGVLDVSSVTTDSAGSAKVQLTPSAGVATASLTASALGAANTRSLTVSGVDFAFQPHAAKVNIDTCTPLKVDLIGAAGPVGFGTTRGTVHADAGCTGAATNLTGIALNGTTATVYVKSSKAGATSVTAFTGTATTVTTFDYVSATAASIQLSASPTTVAIGGSTEVRALVRDAKGNPVENQQVFFSSPGASPSPLTATTNSSGVAVSRFTADQVPSGQAEVDLKAELPGTPLSSITKLTISGSPVQIAIGLDDKIEVVDSPPGYRYKLAVSVKDSNGSPVPGQVVTMSLNTPKFRKGYYVSVTEGWRQVRTVEECPAEDTNGNGVAGPGEPGDVDNDGILDPQNGTTIRAKDTAVVGNTFNVTVGSDGRAEIWLEYLKSEASWIYVDISASAFASGQNAVAHSLFWTSVPASAVSSKESTPAFVDSPFGLSGSCFDPN